MFDNPQMRSPLEKGAAKGRDRRKRQLSNFCVAGMGDCWKYRISQMAVMRDDDCLILAFMPLRGVVPLRGTLSCAFGAPLLQGATRLGLAHFSFIPLRRVVPLRGTLSCAFGAPLLQGATRLGLAHFSFIPLRRVVPLRGTLSCAFGAPLLQGATRVGLAHFSFIPPSGYCFLFLSAKSS